MSGPKIDPSVMVALWNEGQSAKQIAAHFGCKSPAVTRRLNEMGIKVERRPEFKPKTAKIRQTAAMLLHRAKCRAEHSANLDRFADLLADGFTVPEAGAEMGVGYQRAYQFFGSIRKSLGWQAR